jgi:transmembrane sensor
MRFQPDEDASIAERSAMWYTILLEGNEQRAEFFAWLAKSPNHVEAFLRVVNTAQAIAGLSQHQRERVEQLASDFGPHEEETTPVVSIARGDASHDGFPLETASPPPPGGGRSQAYQTAAQNERDRQLTVRWHSQEVHRLSARWIGRVAAMLLVGVGAFLWLNMALRERTYSTGVGEQRVISLSDGSTVTMNTDSEISVRLTQTVRTIRLVRGEALFAVAHDTKRPFDVHVAETVIRAVGTEFDVYRQSASTRVAVINGLVQVSTGKAVPAFPTQRSGGRSGPNPGSLSARPLNATTQFVAAGEAAVVATSGEISRRSVTDPDNAVAWRRNKLVFEDETLTNIAAEFNRYNSILIRVIGKAADQHFSGTFNVHAPEAVMQILAVDSTLQVERIENAIIIRAREEPDAELTLENHNQ